MPMLFVVVAGCNGPTFEEIEDVGGLCILGDGDGSNTSYVENATVDAHVVLQACAPCGATEPLPAGIYTVEYGDETTTLEVPSMGPAAQLGTIQLNEPQCG
jgi:hypothetical protein